MLADEFQVFRAKLIGLHDAGLIAGKYTVSMFHHNRGGGRGAFQNLDMAHIHALFLQGMKYHGSVRVGANRPNK